MNSKVIFWLDQKNEPIIKATIVPASDSEIRDVIANRFVETFINSEFNVCRVNINHDLVLQGYPTGTRSLEIIPVKHEERIDFIKNLPSSWINEWLDSRPKAPHINTEKGVTHRDDLYHTMEITVNSFTRSYDLPAIKILNIHKDTYEFSQDAAKAKKSGKWIKVYDTVDLRSFTDPSTGHLELSDTIIGILKKGLTEDKRTQNTQRHHLHDIITKNERVVEIAHPHFTLKFGNSIKSFDVEEYNTNIDGLLVGFPRSTIFVYTTGISKTKAVIIDLEDEMREVVNTKNNDIQLKFIANNRVSGDPMYRHDNKTYTRNKVGDYLLIADPGTSILDFYENATKLCNNRKDEPLELNGTLIKTDDDAFMISSGETIYTILGVIVNGQPLNTLSVDWLKNYVGKVVKFNVVDKGGIGKFGAYVLFNTTGNTGEQWYESEGTLLHVRDEFRVTHNDMSHKVYGISVGCKPVNIIPVEHLHRLRGLKVKFHMFAGAYVVLPTEDAGDINTVDEQTGKFTSNKSIFAISSNDGIFPICGICVNGHFIKLSYMILDAKWLPRVGSEVKFYVSGKVPHAEAYIVIGME